MTVAYKTRWNSILSKISVIESREAEDWLIRKLIQGFDQPHVLAFVNAHAMNMAATDEDFYQTLHAADILLRDGSGMSLLYRLKNADPGLNMNGTDLIPRLLAGAQGKRVALWGTNAETLGMAEANLSGEVHRLDVVSTLDGFQEETTYLDLVDQIGPDIIVLGMGMPKQERVAYLLRQHMQHPALIICGGAIIDFMSGQVSRAPYFFRKLGLEWLFRFMLEPRRLFKRYLLGNPAFIMRSMAYKYFK